MKRKYLSVDFDDEPVSTGCFINVYGLKLFLQYLTLRISQEHIVRMTVYYRWVSNECGDFSETMHNVSAETDHELRM